MLGCSQSRAGDFPEIRIVFVNARNGLENFEIYEKCGAVTKLCFGCF